MRFGTIQSAYSDEYLKTPIGKKFSEWAAENCPDEEKEVQFRLFRENVWNKIFEKTLTDQDQPLLEQDDRESIVVNDVLEDNVHVQDNGGQIQQIPVKAGEMQNDAEKENVPE